MSANQQPTTELRLDGRETLVIGGVTEIYGYSEDTIKLYTKRGALTIRGGDLRVDKFDGNNAEISGHIDKLSFGKDTPHPVPDNLIRKLLK
jgi:sporulation protein YqfC